MEQYGPPTPNRAVAHPAVDISIAHVCADRSPHPDHVWIFFLFWPPFNQYLRNELGQNVFPNMALWHDSYILTSASRAFVLVGRHTGTAYGIFFYFGPFLINI
jgi:hypothetical protein